MLNLTLNAGELPLYTTAQLETFSPAARSSQQRTAGDIAPMVARALERLEFCFERSRGKYTRAAGQAVVAFDHLNTDHYATYLYFLSNTLWRAGDSRTAAAVYGLNKALHGVDIFYEVELPDIFHLQHPVGTVLGRARYANYFVCYQRVSVGSSLEGDYPEFGEGVVMFGGSGVIGRARIGANNWLSVNTLVMNESTPADAAVFGSSPSLTMKSARRDVRGHFFDSGTTAASTAGKAA